MSRALPNVVTYSAAELRRGEPVAADQLWASNSVLDSAVHVTTSSTIGFDGEQRIASICGGAATRVIVQPVDAVGADGLEVGQLNRSRPISLIAEGCRTVAGD